MNMLIGRRLSCVRLERGLPFGDASLRHLGSSLYIAVLEGLMDWLEFVAKVIGALAWPVVVLVIALKFQAEIRRLLNRIKRMKGPAGTEAEFADEVGELAADAQKKSSAEAKDENLHLQLLQSIANEAGVGLTLGDTRDLRLQPGLIVLRSYSTIEQVMKSLIDDLGLKPASAPPDTPGFYAYTLMEAGVIDRETMDMIHRLRGLRDQLWQVEPDRKTATEYYFTTRKLVVVLGRELHRVRSQRAMVDG